MKSWLYQH